MSTIDQVKEFFDKNAWLREVVEITYAYEKKWNHWYNKTLFDELIDCSKCTEYENYKEIVWWFFESTVQTLQNFANKLKTEWLELIVQRYCLYAIDMINLANTWLPFELEKAWFEHWLEEDEITQLIKKIETIEEKRFGKKVCADKFESSRVVYYLEDLLEVESHLLEENERKEFQTMINILKEKSKYDLNLLWEDDNDRIMTDNAFFTQLLPRDIYAKIFELSLRFYEIDKSVIIDARSSMYDGLDWLHIPDNDGYATMELQRILELIQHEIEVHYIVQENTKALLPITDWANSLFREEWLAKFMEELINGATIASIDISSSLFQILPWEIFTWKKLSSFLQLYWKLKWTENKREWYFLRRKRNYSLLHPWSQHKDVTYSRWRFQVRSWLLNWGDIKKLYLAKIDFEDTETLYDLLSKQEKDALLYPQFFAERILHELMDSKLSFESMLYKKYTFINFDEYPSLELREEQQLIIKQALELIRNNLSIKSYEW